MKGLEDCPLPHKLTFAYKKFYCVFAPNLEVVVHSSSLEHSSDLFTVVFNMCKHLTLS